MLEDVNAYFKRTQRHAPADVVGIAEVLHEDAKKRGRPIELMFNGVPLYVSPKNPVAHDVLSWAMQWGRSRNDKHEQTIRDLRRELAAARGLPLEDESDGMHHPRHEELVAAVAYCCPFGGRPHVVYQPLRRPCDFAVTINGKYTIAAPATEAWQRVEQFMDMGFDFSAAYERFFDRGWNDFQRNGYTHEPDQAVKAKALARLDEITEINKKMDTLVAWICR